MEQIVFTHFLKKGFRTKKWETTEGYQQTDEWGRSTSSFVLGSREVLLPCETQYIVQSKPTHSQQGEAIEYCRFQSPQTHIYQKISKHSFCHTAFLTASFFIQISNTEVDGYSANSGHINTWLFNTMNDNF